MAMADETLNLPALTPISRPLSLIPVGLKEAALDSPTFRATVVHFGEQIDIIEKWLDNYIRSASRLANEVSGIESIINTYLSWATPPAQVSEAILDHDYTALAMKRYNEGAKEFWSSTLKWMKRVESTVVDPIKAFMHTELAGLKSARRNLEQSQRNFDSQISRYASQSKTKEPSALREDAFQLHEARKAYLKASMDFCQIAPQARNAFDKLLVKIFSDRWRDMKTSRDSLATNISKWSGDVDRIRGWSKEMENNERIFKRELHDARVQIEGAAEVAIRPSRELDDYAKSTVAYLGQGPDARSAPQKNGNGDSRGEKQGWLFQRTAQGKPARTVWVRRWFYVRHGIFGWLSNNTRTGSVEESDKVGVLLCGVRPAFQDERRFCFEVKTKDSSIELQAETQSELTEWITTFEVAKRKALENPASTEAIAAGSKSIDAAFAISPPIAPEFAAKNLDVSEDAGPERSATLGLEPPSSTVSRSSTDFGSRRVVTESEGTRDRLMQKLDLHRGKGSVSPAPGASSGLGGIASLITASHTVLPLGGAGHNIAPVLSTDFKAVLGNHIPPSSLAPSTLANPPAPTNLSKTAVAFSGDRNLSLDTAAVDGGMPGGIMANIWGSNNWGYLNRLARGEVKPIVERRRSMSQPPSPNLPDALIPGGTPSMTPARTPSPGSIIASGQLPHRKTYSMTPDLRTLPSKLQGESEYPNYYPLSLKAQDAQFRTLFPEVRREDKLVLVFRATWNPNDQQEFPGRVYVTLHDVYFYSHHMGLVLISGVSLTTIDEITAAPGKDNDYIFLHLKPDVSVDGASRVTMKIYLEPLKLLQKRLNYLVRNADSEEPDTLEETIKTLIKMESTSNEDSPSMDSWEDVDVNTPMDGSRSNDIRTGLRIDGTLFPDPSRNTSRNSTKFRLPAQPVNYAPQGMSLPVVEKEFDVTAKALFHVLAGDKSAVFQMLISENGARNLTQGPWIQSDQSHYRREFKYTVSPDSTKPKEVVDHQLIDVFNDHLCYVITERRTPWSLPSARAFSVISKIVVTHVAKSKCKFAVYAKVEWRTKPLFTGALLQQQALADAALLARSLTAILCDQVAMLGAGPGPNSRKAVQIFGAVGLATQIVLPNLSSTTLPPSTRDRITPHTLPSLTLAFAKTNAIRVLLTVLGALIHLTQALSKIASAHHILVLVLAVSGVANLYFANKDTWGWYRERQARGFMRKIGVTPNTGLGHSIWLHDLDVLATPAPYYSEDGNASTNACRANFNNLLALTDPSSPAPSTHTPVKTLDSNTLTRLQRTRHHFGTYRHDLLVALRVVERVERETVRAEWETWVGVEVGRCRAVGRMLEGKDKGKEMGKEMGKEGEKTEGGVRNTWEGYCGDCEGEGRALGIGAR